MPDSTPAAGIFARARVLLLRNWTIVLPAIVIGFVTNFTLQVLTGASEMSLSDFNGSGPVMFEAYFTSIVAFAIQIFGSVLTIALTTGMAAAAWGRGTATLGDGFSAFTKHPWSATGAILLMMLLGFAAGALIIPTFFISVIAYAIFFIYTMAAVLVGEKPPVEAIVESCTIAAANLRTTVLVVLLIFVVALAAYVLGRFAGAIPLAGPFLEAVLTYAVVAYGTLVVVGEYLQLRRA